MKIAIITGSRADWSGLGQVALALARQHVVLIFATSVKHELSIYQDGLEPFYLADTDHKGFVADRAALVTTCVDRAIHSAQGIDLAFVLGDRWDALAAAMACNINRVPIAHIGGGDRTAGSYDDRMRDAITALSSVHFVTNEEALDRLINRLGVHGSLVFLTGSPALDRVKKRIKHGRGETMENLGVTGGRFRLLNWQPETLAEHPNAGLEAILSAISKQDITTVCVGPNPDLGANAAGAILSDFASARTLSMRYFPSLDLDSYLSALAHCDYLIGNSSSGFYEAPFMAKWSIDVGERQKWRLAAESVICVKSSTSEIDKAIQLTKQPVPQRIQHFYGDGDAAAKIAERVSKITDPRRLLDR